MENDQQGPQVQTQPGVNSPSGPSFPDNCFESIDIQPEFRIPSPQPSMWMRCWQPIGNTVMDTQVLKEPRGFIRIIQFFLGIITALVHTHFSTYFEYKVFCQGENNFTVKHDIVYPFILDHEKSVEVTCHRNHTFHQYPPGDLKSSAVFFAFVGYLSAILAGALLFGYVFFSQKYLDGERKVPKIDCAVSFLVGVVFWLAASSSWANGVITLKAICDPGKESWIFTSTYSICNANEKWGARDCKVTFGGAFGGANAAVILGFLNLFVWCSSLWFIYKETAWFENRSSNSSRDRQQLPS